MAGVTVPVHSAIIDWVLQNIHEEQMEPKVLERLDAWKNGKKVPTMNQIEEMSRKTHIPVGYFFLQTPPQEDVSLVEYRTVGSKTGARASRNLIDILDQMTAIQDWMRDQLQADGAKPLAFVGSADVHEPVSRTAQRIRRSLHLDIRWYEEGRSAEENFGTLRHAAAYWSLPEERSAAIRAGSSMSRSFAPSHWSMPGRRSSSSIRRMHRMDGFFRFCMRRRTFFSAKTACSIMLNGRAAR